MSLTLLCGMKHKSIREYAIEIRTDWQNVSPYAEPYLDAMETIDQITEMFVLDTAESVVLYFLCNCNSWRGENARRIKAELRAICKNADQKTIDKNRAKVYK